MWITCGDFFLGSVADLKDQVMICERGNIFLFTLGSQSTHQQEGSNNKEEYVSCYFDLRLRVVF